MLERGTGRETAEIFGTEMAVGRKYEIKGGKAAVFSWSGCKVRVLNLKEGMSQRRIGEHECWVEPKA
jgi:hypothetical protein